MRFVYSFVGQVFLLAACSAFVPPSPHQHPSISIIGANHGTFHNALGKRKSTELNAISVPMNEHVATRLRTKWNNFYENRIRHAQMTPTVTPDIQFWRKSFLAFFGMLVAFAPKLNVMLVKFWSFLQQSNALLPRMFRHDHWEWVLAVSCFFVYIHGFWLVDKLMVNTANKGVRHPWRKYRLQDEHAVEKWEKSTLKKNNNMPSSQQEADAFSLEPSPMPMPTPSKWHWQAWLFEVPLYMIPLYIWDKLIPRRAARIATFSAPTLSQILSEVTCSLLLYDFVFFFAHLIMHRVPLFYNLFHRKHHTAKEVRACDQVRLSGVEEVLDVGISIWALRFLGAHPVSRTIYNMIITFLLTELHCGYVFPWSLQNVVPMGLVNGSRGHHYHHRAGRHYYQKFFCHLDRLFGYVDTKFKKKGLQEASA